MKQVNEQGKILIYGNGSIARLLHSYPKFKESVIGFTVDDSLIKEGGNTFCGKPLVPFSTVENEFSPNQFKIIIAIGFLGMNNLREQKYQEAADKGYSFASFIHPSVEINNGIEIGENSIILDHVSIHTGSCIGKGTFISSNVNIGHDCNIGDFNWINSGVSIAGYCNIGKRCFWGVNSCLADSIEIGVENFIGANTLISKNSEDLQVHISESAKVFPMKSQSFLKFISRKK
jgi:sugar O-acyltransferase (sialic acid O-acetyltransferase NeuD family)